MNKDKQSTTHFGFEEVPVDEKTERVASVFHSVAQKYDLMNDLMSFGVHRLWKSKAIQLMNVQREQTVLDLAGGTADLTAKLSPLVGDKGEIVLADINSSMLEIGRDRLLDKNNSTNVKVIQANAEHLPFDANYFDRIIIGFGLRNITDKDQALREMFRVLKPGGSAIILEFSEPVVPGLKQLYDVYSFKILPTLGKYVADDEKSYRYLAESIRKHPNQNTLKSMLEQAGFEDCDYHNLAGGIVAVHRGKKY